LQDRIALLEFNSFNDTAIVPQFEALLPELYTAKGVIIDLRKNPGGNSNNGTDILQYFSTDTLWGSTWRTPEHIAAYKAWGRSYYQRGLESEMVPYYTGDAWHQGEDWFVVPDSGSKISVPVVVLFGRNTGSAAEDFLIFADNLAQFVYVGEPSNGSTGQPLFIDGLPGGGTARICTKRDTYRDGRDFVGYGVQPDIAVANTVQALIDGTDPVLDRGLQELKTRMGHP
jgi:C-terminal processing protease CtpA/Prc